MADLDFSGVKGVAIAEGDVVRIELSGTLLWKKGPTNRVPLSIDTDGSIFRGVGYVEGYRLSSSGALSAQSGTVTTGFIRCTAASIIRMAGVTWKPPSGYCYLAFYDSGFALLGSVNVSGTGVRVARGIVDPDESKYRIVTDENGVTLFSIAFTDGSAVAYCRVNGVGKGAAMVVTVNEEIV